MNKLKIKVAGWLLMAAARLMPGDSWMFGAITSPNTPETRKVHIVSDYLDFDQRSAGYRGLLAGAAAATAARSQHATAPAGSVH